MVESMVRDSMVGDNNKRGNKRRVKIGLEIHGYLRIDNKRKLFCDCLIDKNAEPNTNVCPICTGQPGSKPMLPNKEAVDKVIKIALMLGCKINNKLLFQRKHYDWPDLPKGYQITISGSYSNPVGINGSFLGIRISDVHLEEDPAAWDPITGEVDYNRSGFPLVEIVTEPDFESAEEVEDWLRKLLITLSYIRAVDKQAGIKSDVNVSVAPNFVRVEIKNVNSITSIVAAIKHEIKRQLENPPEKQETRTWQQDKTIFMRSKEQAQDYRFIPDPDLPIIKLGDDYIEKLRSELPERPDVKLRKLLDLGVDEVNAKIISSDIAIAELFERILEHYKEMSKKDEKIKGLVKIEDIVNLVRMEVLRVLNSRGLESDDLTTKPKNISKVITRLFIHYKSGRINDRIFRQVLEEIIMNDNLNEDFDMDSYLKEKNLFSIQDDSQIKAWCEEVINKFPKAVEDFKSGNEKAINFLKGKVMQLSKGKADPKIVSELLIKMINSR